MKIFRSAKFSAAYRMAASSTTVLTTVCSGLVEQESTIFEEKVLQLNLF